MHPDAGTRSPSGPATAIADGGRAAPGRDLRAVGDRIEGLLVDLRRSAEPRVVERVEELVGLVTALSGAGLARVLELAGEDRGLVDRMAGDELVATLLVLHGLHPQSVEDRVAAALDEVRPYLGSHGGDVELLGVDDEGVAHLRLHGSCDGCPSSAVTMELAVERAILEAAPEVERVEVEGAGPAAPPGPGPVPVALGRRPAEGTGWVPIHGLRALGSGRLEALVVEGVPVVVCRVGAALFAYRSACPACGAELAGATLDGAALRCPSCGAAFDVPRAGRSLDGTDLHLDPLPLVDEGGEARLAVPAR